MFETFMCQMFNIIKCLFTTADLAPNLFDLNLVWCLMFFSQNVCSHSRMLQVIVFILHKVDCLKHII